MSEPSRSSMVRFFGVDLHKHFLYIAAVNSLQEIVLKPLKIPLEKWPDWARDHLLPTDVVAVESTTNSWDFYDGIVSLVARVEIANAGKLPWIGLSRVKTDKLDAIKLAKEKNIPLLATRYIMFESCGRLFTAGMEGSVQKVGESQD